MKEITVFYTDGANKFVTCVTCQTVEEAIEVVKAELEKCYTVLEEETKGIFEFIYM